MISDRAFSQIGVVRLFEFHIRTLQYTVSVFANKTIEIHHSCSSVTPNLKKKSDRRLECLK